MWSHSGLYSNGFLMRAGGGGGGVSKRSGFEKQAEIFLLRVRVCMCERSLAPLDRPLAPLRALSERRVPLRGKEEMTHL